MHRAFGTGSVCELVAQRGRDNGIRVIEGGCPLMFEPAANGFHKAMCRALMLAGNVPRAVA